VRTCVYILVDGRFYVNGRVYMDFNEATEILTKRCPTLSAVAKEAGVSDGLIRQARLDPDTDSYRRPPQGWEAAVASLARARAAELVKLAADLEE